MSAAALTLSQTRYVSKAFWRNPARAFFTFAFPLMFLVIFTSPLGNGTVRIGALTVKESTYYVASMAAFAVITACFNNTAISTTFNRDNRILKRIDGTPLPHAVFFASRIVHAMLVALLLVVITTAFGHIA
jgi:ABC-2 type transport system permease protein